MMDNILNESSFVVFFTSFQFFVDEKSPEKLLAYLLKCKNAPLKSHKNLTIVQTQLYDENMSQ